MQTVSRQRGMTNGVVIFGMLLLALIIVVSMVRDRIVNNPYDQVSITGTGKVAYAPDTAMVTLGVHFESATAQGALSQMNTTIAKIIPAIQALGVPAENISTQNFSLYPQYYYPENSPARISGYTADEQLYIKISAVEGMSLEDSVAQVIETASTQGANQVIGIAFNASNLDELKQQARLLAIEDARSRAEITADAAGVKLGKVIGWWENQIYVPGNPVPYYDYGYGGEMGGGGMFPSIPTGSDEIVIEVNVNYRVR